MKSKSLVLMLVAMGCGLVAAYTTAKLTAKGQDETERVLVANTEIKIGTVVKEPEKFFVEIDYKKGTAPNAVTDLEKIKDKVVTRTVRPGQFLVPDDLSSNFGITPPKGTKGMAIKVTQDTAVGGFIMPGSRVDVLATIGDSNTKPEVVTVLQNQEVLAVDRISVRPDGQAAVETVNTVTLAVTPNNAMRLELALKQSGGAVRLLLRDQNDVAVNRLNTVKNLIDSGNDFGSDTPGQVRALVAKEDLKPGVKIDDPERFFVAVPVGSVPDRGYLEADIRKLQGQTLRVALFKDGFVTVKHFEGGEEKPATKTETVVAAPTPPPLPEPVRHVMVIQNGGKEAQMVVYQDGMMVNGEHSSGGRPPAPAPKQEPKKDEAKKNEPKPSDENKSDEKPAGDKKNS
ncbi:MAG: Flp pilus assembly protein CpaB [Gemmataceae bacterium]|nr:Flp pilus assembly protein CpaB [Gemmataceae bacterium]